MTILEFIRKNSLLVLIVIVGVGAGLLMMDYSGKASAFSRDFYISVNGTGYNYPETATLGENGKEYLSSLFSATRQMVDQFDTNEDGQFDEQESAALSAWEKEHPEVGQFYSKLNSIYASWAYGPAKDDATNVAINRAILQAEADALGLHPSEAQIDTYLRAMPPFRKDDGSFNQELYRRLAGYRRGSSNRVQEETFRAVIADMMIWDSIQSLVSAGVHYNTQAQLAQLDAFTQSISGRTAWLPASAVPTPEDPAEDDLKAYWEAHKELYKSPERRIVSVYTLAPGAESNVENLLYTTDSLLQDLSQANGQGLDKILADAAENPEFDPFTYKQEDGSTHTTYPLSTQEELHAALSDSVNYDGAETPLSQVAFGELTDAPTVQAYESATAEGNAEKNLTIKQIRGFYTTADGKLKLVRIEAVETPVVLAYEQAREQALADYRAELADRALAEHAQKLYDEMNKLIEEKDLTAAFAHATEVGAQVETYGPLALAQPFAPLPRGMNDADLVSTASGKLARLAILKDGASIASVERRTVVDSPALSMQKRSFLLPVENTRLRRSLIQDWQNSAYSRFNVQLSPSVQTRNSSN